MAAASLTLFGYLMPIFAFLLVFIVVFAILKKTKVLGEDSFVALFISFIMAGFFIVEASLVEFVRLSSAWFTVGIIIVFFLIVLMAFMPGDKPLEFLTAGNWFAWVILGIMVAVFIVTSSYVFNWAINWQLFEEWAGTDFFGVVLLIVIAGIVSWKIKQ